MLLNIKTIMDFDKGSLSFFEAYKDIPFEIKRIYYTYNVPERIKRGGHAHKQLKQILFCPYGKIRVLLDDGDDKQEVVLDTPAKGLIINNEIWHDIIWEEKDSVLCVAASDYYDEEDYIREYDEFAKIYQKIPGGGLTTSFDIKRIYYIYNVPTGVIRGYHAHKSLRQLLFCPYGSVEVTLDKGRSKETVVLSSDSKNFLSIESGNWRTMKFIEKDSILCVAASDYYDEDDYIRNYDEFIRLANEGYWSEKSADKI